MKLTILFFLIVAQTGFSQIVEDTTLIAPVKISNRRTVSSTTQTKIDTILIDGYLTNSLDDLLSETTPVFVKSLGRGALSTVSFRGTSASHTDVLWNGMSVKSPMLGQVDFSQFPVYFMDEVSLSHGGSSIEQTSGALGGAISLENKVDWKNKLSGRVLTGYGSYNTLNNFAQINLGSSKIQSKTRLFSTYSKNDFEFRNKNIADINPSTGKLEYPTQKNNQADYHQYGILQELYKRIGDNYEFSGSYWFQNNKRSLPRLNTYEGDDFSNQNTQTEQTHRAILKITKYGKKSSAELASGIVYSNTNYTLENFVNGLGLLKAIDSRSSYATFYNKISYNYNLNKKNTLKFNYNLNYHKVRSEERINKTGFDADRLEHLLFAHWNRKWNSRLKSDVMIRMNRIDKMNLPIIPYLGLSYLASKKHHLSIKTSVTRNYRQPTLNDLYWQPGGNINLLPEEGISGDLGIEHQLKYKKLSLTSELTFFQSQIKNWIIWLPTVQGFWQPDNIQNVSNRGLEVHLAGDWKFKNILFNFNSNYAYTLSTNQGDPEIWGEESIGKQLPYVPVHSFNLFLKTSYKGFFMSYAHNSYSERFTTATNDISRRDWLYPYFMNSIYFGKELTLKKSTLIIELKTYNLFNEEYRSVLGRPMPGRNYLLTLMFKF